MKTRNNKNINKTIIKRNRKLLEERRLRAGKMFEKHIAQVKVAHKLQVSKASVCDWHKRWKSDKKDGLRSKGHPGFKSKYTQEKQKQLRKIIIEGPNKHGFDTNFWTLERIQKIAKKELKINLGIIRTYNVLKILGFSCQKPIRRAKERNERYISTWKKKIFPKLKKTI